MQFFTRVHIYSSVGRWLAKVPACQIPRLLKHSAVVDERRNGKVFSVRLMNGGIVPIKPLTPLTPSSYAGQRYVRQEAVGGVDEQRARCYCLKKIHDDDAELFGALALADVCK